jgi:hypothetical protein
MAAWVKAIVREDPDPVGKRDPRRGVTHAYDLDVGQPAHHVTGQYEVRKDEPWRDPVLRGDRCVECQGVADS